MFRFPGVLALVLLVAPIMAIHSAAAAGPGSVSLQPASSDVVQGGSTAVSVMIDPPPEGVSIWIVEIAYDPSIVQVAGCTFLSISIGVAGAAGCATKDTNSDSIDDTAVAYGGWVENVGGTPHGFETAQTVATFGFTGIGDPGTTSALTTSIFSELSPNGDPLHMAPSDGSIHIESNAVGGSVEMITVPRSGAGSWAWLPAAWWLALGLAATVAVVGVRRWRRDSQV